MMSTCDLCAFGFSKLKYPARKDVCARTWRKDGRSRVWSRPDSERRQEKGLEREDLLISMSCSAIREASFDSVAESAHLVGRGGN